MPASSAACSRVRGEFGYWVFEGDWGQPAQRPSWNYRKAEGGGIILDMLCHWRYVLDNLFGDVKAVSCLGATHIPSRVDENGKTYAADTDDAAYATFQLEGGVIAHINSSWATRVRRDDLVTFHVDGTHGSAVAGLTRCLTQARVNTPRPVWNPDVPQTMKFLDQWEEVPDNITYENGFKIQWEDFIRHVVRGYAVEVRPGRRREGRAACRTRPEELGRAALARRAGAQYLRRFAWRRFHCRPRIAASRPTPPASRSCCRRRARRRSSTASLMRPRMSSPIRSPTTIRGSMRRSTGTRPSRSANTSGTSASASPRRWTPRSAAWASTGTARKELIRRALEAARRRPGVKIACGVGTDHLDANARVSIDDIIRAYEEQIETIEGMGGQLILMASRALARARESPEDYARVYGRILRQVKQPVIIHWLGEMFDPALAGYWGVAGPHGGDGNVPRRSCRTTPPRSMASRFRCCRRRRKSRCAAACPTACACIPATTSTTPS